MRNFGRLETLFVSCVRVFFLCLLRLDSVDSLVSFGCPDVFAECSGFVSCL